MNDRGGFTCQRCVNVTEVECMSEAERQKRGNVRMTEEDRYRVRGGKKGNVRVTEEYYHVRGGCILQAWRDTSKSVALMWGMPSEAGTDGGERSSMGSGAGRVPAFVHSEWAGTTGGGCQFPAWGQDKGEDDWTMCRGRIAGYPGGPGGWQGPQQLRGRIQWRVVVKLKFYVNSRRLTGSRELRRAGNCSGPSLGMASSKLRRAQHQPIFTIRTALQSWDPSASFDVHHACVVPKGNPLARSNKNIAFAPGRDFGVHPVAAQWSWRFFILSRQTL